VHRKRATRKRKHYGNNQTAQFHRRLLIWCYGRTWPLPLDGARLPPFRDARRFYTFARRIK
jgi:hypothetical protein